MHKTPIVLASLVLGGSALTVEYAWWVTVRFRPASNTVAGIPVEQIDPTWARASKLEVEALPVEALAPGESLQEHGASFSVDEDFDSDGESESALVGVYETTGGSFGRFLLIIDGESRALFKQEGKPGFSALWYREKELMWAPCMECDSTCVVVRQDGEYELQCSSGPD